MSQVSSMIDLLEAGIKAEGLRQQSIASNIANLETPGYRRIDVKFEEMLAKALDSASIGNAEIAEPELYQPDNTPLKSNGNDVDLETEIGALVKNSLRHTAYIRILQKKFAQIEAAMQVSG
jgi:flagellar basal-body rod protein FlgB